MNEATGTRPAGFWIRAAALVIDLAVFALVLLSFGAIGRRLLGLGGDGAADHPSVALFTLLFTAVYTIALHTVAGQTLGKSIVGVQVVGADGGRLTLGPALLRYLACYLSLAPLGLGFLMAGLRRDRRALHDLVAGTRVERLPSARRATRRATPPRPPAEPPSDPAVRPPADSDSGR
jgi:uncharacterized RDD family membrane protein YckC